MRIYSDVLHEEFDLAELEKTYGIEREGDVVYYLTQQPFITGSNDNAYYSAVAIDSAGNAYEVRWPVVEGYEEIEDESGKADWNSPTIRRI